MTKNTKELAQIVVLAIAIVVLCLLKSGPPRVAMMELVRTPDKYRDTVTFEATLISGPQSGRFQKIGLFSDSSLVSMELGDGPDVLEMVALPQDVPNNLRVGMRIVVTGKYSKLNNDVFVGEHCEVRTEN
jgi:hypothetical protein